MLKIYIKNLSSGHRELGQDGDVGVRTPASLNRKSPKSKKRLRVNMKRGEAHPFGMAAMVRAPASSVTNFTVSLSVQKDELCKKTQEVHSGAKSVQ